MGANPIDTTQKKMNKKELKKYMDQQINYLSLFSGIGGFEYGIKQSNKNKILNCIGYSEVDKYAENIYKKHYPNHIKYGDVRNINPEELPEFELLVGGFPCQAFSHAGKRGGFNDTRGTLFFEIARILRDKKPKYFLLENVKGLLSHDKGRTFQTILGTLSELGYDVTWEIFNSKNHGVPQNRERIYIKGFFRKRSGPEILSEPKTNRKNNATSREYGRIQFKEWGKSSNVIVNPEQITPTLGAVGQQSGGRMIIPLKTEKNPRDCRGRVQSGRSIYFKVKNNTRKGYLEAEEGDGVIITPRDCRGRVQKQSTPTLNTTGDVGTVTPDYKIRRLTPRECERLQGFPDDYTRYGADGAEISDTQRYKCCGNAVTTNVIKYIFDNWDLTPPQK